MQPKRELRLYPMKLSEFGITPGGDDVYRLVWSDSRKSVAYRGEQQLVTPKYQHGAESELASKWVLEKWLPASMYYGMTADMWNELQKVAPQEKRMTTMQDRAADAFLATLDPEMRTLAEASLTKPQRIPIIEPYSYEGDYEFAGLYFAGHVDESYLRFQVAAHIYKLTHTTEQDRKVEEEAKEVLQEKKNEETFDEIWDESREAAMMSV